MVGVLVAISSAVALTGNRRAIAKLAALGVARADQDAHALPPVIGLRSDETRAQHARGDPHPTRRPAVTWLYPWTMLPWALALAWLLIPILWAVAD
jgi:hypothetical protein